MILSKICLQPPQTPVDKLTDGPEVTHLDPADPAYPGYRLLARLRSPIALRDLMILPVRTGYIGKDHPIDPKELPPAAAEVYPDVQVVDIFIPSPAGPVRCQVYSPPRADGPLPVVLYMHGGGFTVGQSEDTAYITSRLAVDNGMVAVSVNYRLAPEWPFPYGLDDCLAVLAWLRGNAAEIGGDAARIAVAGDSAGGNFAAALPLKARDAGVAPPEAAILLCPVTDFFCERYDSFERLAPRGLVFDTPFMGFIRGAYLTRLRDWSHPHASPANGDLSDYPPTFIASGTQDPLIDENSAFARKLAESGRDVTHHVQEGMPHGWYFFPGVFRQGDETYAGIQAFLAKTLFATTAPPD